ncbi:hypothetical protein KUTeg_013581 [Tegillarca granosa]|uniref:Enhancer of rudimentary homolog n=1 Tax=Tegillarca granosa TaxID=220873 RepID=A0ABQ9EU43_TEGGR|nr:hypothetical protein KUTeg_013581 [Tegillarca granosa]
MNNYIGYVTVEILTPITSLFSFNGMRIIMAHTILLVQPNHKAETRTYSDYESLNECLEGICKIFEEHLKRCHPDQPSITYDISQLFDFIDKLKDLCCLVSHKIKNIKLYCPHSKEWLKEKIYIMLRKQAGKA